MREHVAEEQPQIREFLPVVAGHFLEQGALSVHDFIVRERQYEILVEGVEQRESQFAVMMLPEERIERTYIAACRSSSPCSISNRSPGPPMYTGRETAGHAVDSSAIVSAPGCR